MPHINIGHHANQAYYKSGIISPEYHGEVNNPMIYSDKLLTSHYIDVILRDKS